MPAFVTGLKLRFWGSLFLALVVSSILACSSAKPLPASTHAPNSLNASKLDSQTVKKEEWQVEWDRILEGAKKEGKVVVYSTAPGEVRAALQNGFKERHGIPAEVFTLRGGEIATKFLGERRNSLFLVDVYMGGTTTAITQLKPAGALAPLEPSLLLPEVRDPKVWYGDGLGWVDTAHRVLKFLGYPAGSLARNTRLVKEEEAKSLKDLLEPRWKGKIVMNDPTIAGNGAKGFAVIGFYLMNLDYWKELARQEPAILRDERLIVEWLAQGKFPIVLFPQSGIMTEFEKAGAPVIKYVPIEGTYLSSGSGNISLVDNAPHPNAARLFANWLLSREGQTVFSQAFGRQSLRLDVTTEGLDRETMRQPGAKYFRGADNEEFLLKQTEQMMVAREIFAPYLK